MQLKAFAKRCVTGDGGFASTFACCLHTSLMLRELHPCQPCALLLEEFAISPLPLPCCSVIGLNEKTHVEIAFSLDNQHQPIMVGKLGNAVNISGLKEVDVRALDSTVNMAVIGKRNLLEELNGSCSMCVKK